MRTKEPFQADYILMEILGLWSNTPDLDERATTQELEDLEADAHRKDAILEDWHTPPGQPTTLRPYRETLKRSPSARLPRLGTRGRRKKRNPVPTTQRKKMTGS